MEVNGQIGFYVRFLGGFSLWFEGRELPVKANPLGKTMQMLFFLLKAGSSGCEKKELLELVRPGEKNRERQLNNFRQQLYMMRKLIAASHFPEGKYIVYRGTRYYFTLDYPIWTDTEKLDNLIGQIRNSPGKGQELEKHCQEYCERYIGEFLPLLGGEEWVALESAYYQKWYFTCLNKLCVRLKEQKRFETLLHLAETASQIHPYDEWQVVQMDCLMALNRRKEAEKVYEEASQVYYRDLGMNALDRVVAGYQESSRFYHIGRIMNRVKNSLEEYGRVKGAYWCSYPSFVDIYRVRARIGEQRKESNLLLLCTLEEKPYSGGGWEKEKQEEQMELFQKVLHHGTRSEDVYTQYSKSQYLVLLSGADKGTGKVITSRLTSIWKKAGGQAEIKFSVSELDRLDRSERTERKNKA